MNPKKLACGLLLGFLCSTSSTLLAGETVVSAARPVTPNASPEAVQLLQYIYSISGNHTLTGQHAVPLLRTARLVEAQRAGAHFPAVFGMDFGFDSPGTWDGINFRQNIVDDAIQKYRQGYIIVLMWHAVRPIEDEPVQFKTSIQGKLTDEQWHDLVTPGTEINERWKSQVDVIAWFLAQLRDAHVPVLWRPYHEMNGGWFWWGKKPGPDGYKKLYRMLFDRLVKFHRLNNLIWVYGCNEMTPGVDPYGEYYPGDDVVDILGTDIYHSGFAREQYDRLLALAKGKPIALAEVGVAPSPAILTKQPRWAWFMVWDDPTEGGHTAETVRSAYNGASAVSLDRLPWVKAGHPAEHTFTQP